MKPIDELDISTMRVLDGGMATELERRGCDISGPLWSAHVLRDSPAAVEAVHTAYLEAGADCILTASYQVSFSGYAAFGLSAEETRHSLRESVRLADAARLAYGLRNPRPVWVAASLGPYGAALHNGAEYHGNYDCSFETLVQFHAERLAALESTDADFVAFETVPSLAEGEAIVAALRQYPHLGAWVSFTCKDCLHTARGEPLSECAAMLKSERQVVAVGVNCTAPSLITSLINSLTAASTGKSSSATSKPIIVYPNSGEQWDAASRSWQGDRDASAFGPLAREWFRAGARAVGGCCRTGPEHICAIRDA